MNTKTLIPLTILVMSLVFPLSVAQFAYAQTAFINLTVLKPVPGDVFYQGDDIAFMVQVTDDGLNPVEGAHVNLQVWDPDGFPVAAVLGWTAQDGRIPVYASTLIPWGSEYPYKYNASEGQFGLRIKSNFNPGTYTYTVTATFKTGFPPATLTDFKTGSFVVQAFVPATGIQQILDLIGAPASTLFEELAEVKANQEALSAQMALLETNVVESIASVGTALLDAVSDITDIVSTLPDQIAGVRQEVADQFDALKTVTLAFMHDELETAIVVSRAELAADIAALSTFTANAFEETLSSMTANFQAILDTMTDGFAETLSLLTTGFESTGATIVETIESSTVAVKGSVGEATVAILETVEGSNSDLAAVILASSEDLSAFLLAISVLISITLLLAAVAAVRVVRLKA